MAPRTDMARVSSTKLRGSITRTARDLVAAASILTIDAGGLLPRVAPRRDAEDPRQLTADEGQTLP